MKIQIDLTGVAEYWPMIDAAANPALVRTVLMTRLALGMRTKQTTEAAADMLRLLEHAVRVNGVEVVP